MQTKFQQFCDLSEQTVKDLMKKRGDWQRFLETSGRLYKYTFPEQLLVYAQKPESMAVAPIELWNNTFNRFIKRNSKGIALIDDSGNYPKLRYVFDVADTEPAIQNARPVYVWQMNNEHTAPVLAALAQTYDGIVNSVTDSFRNIAKQLAEEYYRDNARDIQNRTEDSLFEAEVHYDDDGFPFDERDYALLDTQFVDMLTKSVTYSVMARCGINAAEYFDEEDFVDITQFNTPDILHALGTATADLSSQVLRDIEIVVKRIERAKTQEKSAERGNENEHQLHNNRGLSNSGHQTFGIAGADGNVGQIRENEKIVSERTSPDSVQSAAVEREFVPAFEGNRTGGGTQNGEDNEHTDGAESAPESGNRADEVDGGDEQSDRPSGGNGAERTDLRITEPLTYSQVGNSNIKDIISTSPITMGEVDSVLRDGANDDTSVLRIAAHFAKGKDDNAKFLRREYLNGRFGHSESESGKGFDFGDKHNVCAWFDNDGISLAVGSTAKNNIHKITITWETAAARIQELFTAGQYVTQEKLSESLDNEMHEMAGKLWFFYRDDMNFLPEEWNAEKGGYPEDEAIIERLLNDKDERQKILDKLEIDVAEFANSDERSWHNPPQLLADMRDLTLTNYSFPKAEIENLPFKYFLTQDEIDSYLTGGSSFQDGEMRILSFYLQHSDEKERANFLKKEYGLGGGGTLTAIDGWADYSPSKGITLKRGNIMKPDTTINLKWNAASKRIGELIKTGHYVTQEMLNYIPKYERDILTRKVYHFFSSLPEDFEKPFEFESKFLPDRSDYEKVSLIIDDGEKVQTTLARMQSVLENTSTEDRHYDSRKSAVEMLTEFVNGTYTLFPGVENLPEYGTSIAVKVTGRKKPTPEEMGQMSLFAFENAAPKLPMVTEQLTVIKQSQPAPEQSPEIDKSVETEIDIDGDLLDISDGDKARILAQFTENPRSREAVSLVKEIYGGSLEIPLNQAVKRLSELVADGEFNDLGDPYNLFDDVREELSERGHDVAGSAVEDLINRFRHEGGTGDFNDVVDFIEREYIAKQPKAKLDFLSEVERIKAENGGATVMRQVGDFYEMYNNDAKISATVLGVTMTEISRDVPKPYLLTGIPSHKLDEYTKELTGNGHSLAIVENGELTRLITVENATTEPTNDSWTNLTHEPVREADANITPDAPAAREPIIHRLVPLYEGVTADINGVQMVFSGTDGTNVSYRESGSRDVAENYREISIYDLAQAGYHFDNSEPNAFVIGGGIPIFNAHRNNLPTIYGYITNEQGEDWYVDKSGNRLVKTEWQRAKEREQAQSKVADELDELEIESVFDEPETPIELDFDTVAQTVLERVMSDYGYKTALTEATSRASLRNPCTIAVEESIRDHFDDEPEVFRQYFSDDDFNDELFNYVLRQSWENRNKPEQMQHESTHQSGTPPIMVIDNTAQQNFNLFALTFPKIVDGTHQSERYKDDNRRTLSVFHDTTNAGLIHVDISYYSPDGRPISDPTISATANFERRMLTAENYANTRTGEDIGLLTLATETDEEKAQLGLKLAEFLDEIRNPNLMQDFHSTWTLEHSDVFRDADGKELPAEPKANFDDFLKESADREVKAHEYVQRNMFGGGNDENSSETKESKKIKANNFRITDEHLGEGGLKSKYHCNVEALRTLKTLDEENRQPTEIEREKLSRYVGWGALQAAFDETNEQWQNEYTELKNLMSPEEYKAARATTLNAFYTSPTVINAMYEAVEQLGFKKGNILEPSCGVGNFLGLIPDKMKSSRLYATELDPVTAKIATILYPKANIENKGFEEAEYNDSFFDLAIGNVPFGGYGVSDGRYNQLNLPIHDYFFAKTLDKVRPGGIVAFVTSKGTLDKENPNFRKYLAQRAELLGAIRLPNTTFKANAGTEVTSDIIFLQKRDRLIDIEPDWVHLGKTKNNISVNQYFVENPNMILGTMAKGKSLYGNENETTCEPIPDTELKELLSAAIENIEGQYSEPEIDELDGNFSKVIQADSHVKNFSYALVTPTVADDSGTMYADKIGVGEVYFRENSVMFPVELPIATLDKIKGMIALRDCTHKLIDMQLQNESDAAISEQQSELNYLYDHFIYDNGLINSPQNAKAFSADSSYYLLCSLEILDDDGNLKRKADMFTKRTINQKKIITHADTATEALAVSLSENGFVDMDFISELTGRDEATLFNELRGVIFADFDMDVYSNNIKHCEIKSWGYKTADEFLSGNIREKLKRYTDALAVVPDDYVHVNAFRDNVAALEKAMPSQLEASEISVRLGATWIDAGYVEQFMYSLLKTPWRQQSTYKVKYHDITGEWQVTNKGKANYGDINATVTYGTSRMNAYQIIDDTLNLRDVRVYDYKDGPDGKTIRVLNRKDTTLAQQKQEQIKSAFKDWIWAEPTRRQTIVEKYNVMFNSVRPREYDGSHLTFPGMTVLKEMRPHQKNGVARIMYGGNTLLAHVVGAGKTYQMAAAAMEMKRLGLCHKTMIAVPNHLTEQIAADFLELYPSANILVATKKDFEMRNRKKFCARISTGDYDAVILGHTQLEKIPVSHGRQVRLLEEQIGDIMSGIEQLKAEKGDRLTIKQYEKTSKNLQSKLKKLTESKPRDDVVTFEQLGIDRLMVDEAHFYKNLFLHTKMRNVAGLSATEAQKSSDLFMKCRYMDEITGGRGITFCTGTPVSNSMTELYTMQRYLQYDELSRLRMTHFDCWASTFGETKTTVELALEGTGYRARTRFAQFYNLPELMNLFRSVADIQTADMLNLPVPEAHYETIVVEPSDLQAEMVQELSKRASAVHNRQVSPDEDNMLKITTDGRKIGLEQRLMNELLPDHEGSKINACADKVFEIWDNNKSDSLTQIVFCDFSTPNKDGRFNVYDDMREKLLGRGIPKHEIAFIHDAEKESDKKELFAKVRTGKVRVLFGSTAKLGAGTNVRVTRF